MRTNLQFDESTDVSGCAALLGFIRYVHHWAVKEVLICEDVFSVVTIFQGEEWIGVEECATGFC